MAEPEPAYSAGEAARLAALLTRGAYLAQRGKSTAEVEGKIDALKEMARRRIAAESIAREREEARRVQERAERTAARRWF